MKRIIQAVAVSVLLSASSAWAFGIAADSSVGQPTLDTYADRHAREGTLNVGFSPAHAAAAETNVGQPALDTYADSYARKGTVLGSAESPFPISADVDMRYWSVDSKDAA